MALTVSDKISSQEKRELKRLRRRRRTGLFGTILLVFVIAIASYVIFSAILPEATVNKTSGVINISESLHSSRVHYFEWLSQNGFFGSSRIYEFFSQRVIVSANGMLPASISATDIGTLDRLLLYFYSGLLQFLFLICAWWWLWAIVGVGAFYTGTLAWSPYSANDILGDRTNGRLFYSGIKVDLKRQSASGAPDVLVQGLAAMRTTSITEARFSEVGKVLQQFGVANDTNVSLAGIIQAYADIPAYVAYKNELELFNQTFSNDKNLEQNAAIMLATVLTVHSQYSNDSSCLQDRFSAQNTVAQQTKPFGTQEYRNIIGEAFHRTLTPGMRSDISRIPAVELATIVLAIEAGKAMAFGKEGDRWVYTSQFPQLCARSVLHSVAAYSKEYTYEERSRIRRSVIYGSRKRIFGPVKFADDLSVETRAARQWAELLMSSPHNLDLIANELELYALVGEINEKWSDYIIDAVMTRDSQLYDSLSTYASLFFLPFRYVMKLLRRVVTNDEIEHLHRLVDIVYQQQQLTHLEADDGEAQALTTAEKVLAPLEDDTIKKIAKEHQVSEEDLHDWSVLRVALNRFGWLGRRVADKSVPASSIVMLLFEKDNGFDENAPREINGLRGMVPFRNTRFEEKWNKRWSEQATLFRGVAIPESLDEFLIAIGERESNKDDNDQKEGSEKKVNA